MRPTCANLLALVLSASIVVGACGDERDLAHDHAHSHEHSHEDMQSEPGQGIVIEACAHAASGPFAEVNAAAEAKDAPSANFPHTALHINLVEEGADSGQYTGYVSYEAGATSGFHVFLSADLPFTIFDASDSAVPLNESVSIDTCSELRRHHRVDLNGGVYTLWFGPTSDVAVTLVVEQAW